MIIDGGHFYFAWNIMSHNYSVIALNTNNVILVVVSIC